MPMAHNEGYAASVSSASAVLGPLEITIPAGGEWYTIPLDVADLPRLLFYMLETSAGAVTFTPQFSVSDVATALSGQIPQWFDLQSAAALVPGEPTLVPLTFPAKFVRLHFQAPALAQTVTCILAATQ